MGMDIQQDKAMNKTRKPKASTGGRGGAKGEMIGKGSV